MRERAGAVLLWIAALAAVLAAILLPPKLSAWADSRLDERRYTAPAGDLDMSLIYGLTVPERLDLVSQYRSSSVLFTQYDRSGGDYADSLDWDQAVTSCKNELNRLADAGILPIRFALVKVMDQRYTILQDIDNPHRSVSLWLLQLLLVEESNNSADMLVNVAADAQNGLIYAFSLYDEPGFPRLPYDLSEVAGLWGDYLGLGSPTDLSCSVTAPAEGKGGSVASTPAEGKDAVVSWVTPPQESLWMEYRADGLTISYCVDAAAHSPDMDLWHQMTFNLQSMDGKLVDLFR